MSAAGWIDELEAELGQAARLRVIANLGGRRLRIPTPRNASRSVLVEQIGLDAAEWLAARFGGEEIDIPNAGVAQRSEKSAQLLADILEAGLDNPTRSANDIARQHGVTRRWVVMLRAELRAGQRADDRDQLSLF